MRYRVKGLDLALENFEIGEVLIRERAVLRRFKRRRVAALQFYAGREIIAALATKNFFLGLLTHRRDESRNAPSRNGSTAQDFPLLVDMTLLAWNSYEQSK
jgi:hypothetical protein